MGEEEEAIKGDNKIKESADELDNLILELSLALIQQRLDIRAVDSPMVSFAAVLAWDPKERS